MWISLHCYPKTSLSFFLKKTIFPLVEEGLAAQWLERYFFVRYQDKKGQHIRLRLWLKEDSKDFFEVEKYLQSVDYQRVSYVPEVRRYGGTEGLPIAEQYFFESSEAVRRADCTDGEAALGAAIQMNLATVVGFGWTVETAISFFKKFQEIWLQPVFFGEQTDDVKSWQTLMYKRFEANWQASNLAEAVINLWSVLKSETVFEPEWLCTLRTNSQRLARQFEQTTLNQPLPDVVQSLVHLNHNRLGVANYDEAFLAFLVGRSLERLLPKKLS